MKRTTMIALAGMIGATMVVPTIADAATSGAVYDSTPAKGTVSVPSVGPEAYSFDQVGNEVILKQHRAPIRHVSATMESWACQSGDWTNGCVTTPGSTFKAPITLHLYRYSHPQATGEVTPGKQIMSVTKTFDIRYRPRSEAACGLENGVPTMFTGRDGACHHGIAQNISFPINRKLGNDIVWTVSYNTNTSGPNPLGHAGPMDSLNVGLTTATSAGHDRFPGTIFWDTRYAGFTGGAPFVLGELNRDTSTDPGVGVGCAPAAKFSTR